mgnify:FL=1
MTETAVLDVTGVRSLHTTSPVDDSNHATRQASAHSTRSPLTCYQRECGHEECRQANADARRRRWRELNRPDTVAPPATVPAGIVRTHIVELREHGLGVREIARRADVRQSTVDRILSGETKRVTPTTKDAILGVLPSSVAPGTLVPAEPTLDRLSELYATDMTQADIAEATGLPLSTIRSITPDRTMVRARTEQAIAELHAAEGLAGMDRSDADPLADWLIFLEDIGSQQWRRDAECRRLSGTVRDRVNLFFPDRGGDTATPKAVCARCPVTAECEDFAVRTGTLIGIWGQRTGSDLRSIRHDDQVAARQPEPVT